MNETIPYYPEMTPGRVLYERWLAAQDISPDDLWDHLEPPEQDAWAKLVKFVPDESGIEPAGVSDGITREHPVIRVEPRERLVAGLVAWVKLAKRPAPDLDWYLKRLEALFQDVREGLAPNYEPPGSGASLTRADELRHARRLSGDSGEAEDRYAMEADWRRRGSRGMPSTGR